LGELSPKIGIDLPKLDHRGINYRGHLTLTSVASLCKEARPCRRSFDFFASHAG
jgi:hypothetical protein